MNSLNEEVIVADESRAEPESPLAPVAVIIVNYNGGKYLPRCLDCIHQQSVTPMQLIVVDNASNDGSIEFIQQQYPDGEYIKNHKNLGFAEACNQGIEAAEKIGTKYVALLNPDAFPEYNWLNELIETADRRPDCGSVASCMMQARSEGIVDGLGDAYHWLGFSWRRGHGEFAEHGFEGEHEVFGACAGAALYRVDAIRDVGNFDADFFCYMEDVDLAYRLRLAGYKCVLNCRALVAHEGSGITGYRSDFSTYYGHRNLPWVFIKNTPSMLLWLILPGHLLINVVALLVAARRRQFGIVLRAKRDALAGIGLMLTKRSRIQKRRTISLMSLWRSFDKSMFTRRVL